jgi:hypothetical protein
MMCGNKRASKEGQIKMGICGLGKCVEVMHSGMMLIKLCDWQASKS